MGGGGVGCFDVSPTVQYSGTVSNNSGYGIVAAVDAHFSNFKTRNTIIGNTKGLELVATGGKTNY